MSPADYMAFASLGVALACVATTGAVVRWVLRASARKEELLYAKIADLLDRNMHLTDGGAFKARQGAGDGRSILDDDTPTGRHFTQGILLDPENGVPDFAYSLHEQPTADDLT